MQEALSRDSHALDAAELAQMTSGRLQALLSLAAPMPLQEERAALLREVLLCRCDYLDQPASALQHARADS